MSYRWKSNHTPILDFHAYYIAELYSVVSPLGMTQATAQLRCQCKTSLIQAHMCVNKQHMTESVTSVYKCGWN